MEGVDTQTFHHTRAGMWLSFAPTLLLGVEEGVKASMVQAFFLGSLLDLGLLTYAVEACCSQLEPDGRWYRCTASAAHSLRNQVGDRHLLCFAEENNNKDDPSHVVVHSHIPELAPPGEWP